MSPLARALLIVAALLALPFLIARAMRTNRR